MCSIGLDKNIVFYDINDKIIVKRIKTETPLQSVAFCTDGHTIAIGASNYGAILIYDLRKSSKEVAKVCTGHKSTVNSLKFTNKAQSKSDKIEGMSKDTKSKSAVSPDKLKAETIKKHHLTVETKKDESPKK
jgi:WD40 repeat protein